VFDPMLKFLFWVLLLANGVLLAANFGYLDGVRGTVREPERLAAQLNPDKIRPITPEAAQAAVAAAKRETLACVEVAAFDEAEARQFEARLAVLALGERVSRRVLADGARHIVFIPPQGGREGADRKVAELKKLGVADFFVIQDSSDLRWGISLGVFKTEDAAATHLAALARKGVRSARLGMMVTGAEKVAVQLRRLDAAAQSGLDKIKADFPNQEMRACPPEQP
jgi:hypothetical protein